MAKKKENDFAALELISAIRNRASIAKAALSGELEEQRKKAIRDGAAPWTILRYGRITELEEVPFPIAVDSYVRPKTFERHVKYLAQECNVLPLRELLRRIDYDEEIPEKAVAITFDNGHADLYRNAAPILLEYGLPATVYLRTLFTGSDLLLFDDRISLALLLYKLDNKKLPLFEVMDPDIIKAIRTESPTLDVTEETIALFSKGDESVDAGTSVASPSIPF